MAEIVVKKNNINQILKGFNSAIEKSCEEIGLYVEGKAKKIITDNGSVDTGRLRGSITYATTTKRSEPSIPADVGDAVPVDSPEEHAVYIGTNVEYAAYVEYGHRVGTSQSFVPPNPYLKPAIEQSRGEILKIIQENLRKS